MPSISVGKGHKKGAFEGLGEKLRFLFRSDPKVSVVLAGMAQFWPELVGILFRFRENPTHSVRNWPERNGIDNYGRNNHLNFSQ